MPLACWTNLLSFRLNIAKRCPYIIKIIHFDTQSTGYKPVKCQTKTCLFSGVEIDEAFHGALNDGADFATAGLGGLGEDVAVVVGN